MAGEVNRRVVIGTAVLCVRDRQHNHDVHGNCNNGFGGVMMRHLGIWIKERGLLLANLALFATFFVGMIISGVQVYNADQVEHGQPTVSLGGYLTSGDFVEATFENWESEFLQMGVYVLFTAWLIQKGSPESKPVAAPHAQTGTG